jgi:hypothetical protein
MGRKNIYIKEWWYISKESFTRTASNPEPTNPPPELTNS